MKFFMLTVVLLSSGVDAFFSDCSFPFSLMCGTTRRRRTTTVRPTAPLPDLGSVDTLEDLDHILSSVDSHTPGSVEAFQFVDETLNKIDSIDTEDSNSTDQWLSVFNTISKFSESFQADTAKKFLNSSTTILGNVLQNTAGNIAQDDALLVALSIEDYAVVASDALLRNTNGTEGRANLEFEFAEIEACKSQTGSCQLESDEAAIEPRDIDEQEVFITYVIYKISPLIFGSNLATSLVSVTSRDGDGTTLSNGVDFTLQHIPSSGESNQPSCQFINETTLEWSSDGCDVVSSNATHTRCSCDHMTNFAILFLHSDISISAEEELWFDIITYVGCGISITACLVTMVTFALLRLHHSQRIILLWHLCFSLCMAQMVLVAGTNMKVNTVECKIVAILLHFFFMSSFAWMLMEGIHLYFKAARAVQGGLNFKALIVAGWIIPILIVGVSLGAGFNGYGTERGCWLSITGGLIWAFIGPALGFIVVNCILLGFVIKVFLGLKTVNKTSEFERTKRAAKAIAFLLPLLGVTWVFGLLAVDSSTKWFLYIFSVFNSLQGLAIFVLHCIRNDEVRKAFLKKYKRSLLSVGPFSTSSSSAIPKSDITFIKSTSTSQSSPPSLPKMAKW